jgi:hypothetical protein
MKKIVITSIIVIVLATVAVWLVKSKGGKGTVDEKLKDFAVEDTASITKIFLVDKSGKNVTLTREESGAWKVNNKYFARKDAVDILLYTIKSIEVKSIVGKKAQDNVVKQLATGATKIEIYKGDDLVKVYYVGRETQDALGTYMLMVNEKTGQNSSVPFITYIPGFEGYLTTRYFTDESDWRDRIVFRYVPTDIKSVKVEYPGSLDQSFEVINKGNNTFDVRSLKTNASIPGFDTLAIKQYLSYYQNIQFESVEKEVQKVQRDSILMSPPFAVITVTDMKGASNMAKLFHKKAPPEKLDVNGQPMKYDVDRCYGLINNGQDFVLCQYYVFGKLLQSPAYFTSKREVVKK